MTESRQAGKILSINSVNPVMKKPFPEFFGIEVDEAEYARLAPVIDLMRDLLSVDRKEDVASDGGLENGNATFGRVQDFTSFNRVREFAGIVLNLPADALSRTLNILLVQAGSKCGRGRPKSVIEHHVGPSESYFQCGHSDPPHYWDESGNQLDERP